MTHYNKGKRWTEEMDHELIHYIKENIDIEDISEIIGRTPKSIGCQLEKILVRYDPEFDPKSYYNYLYDRIKKLKDMNLNISKLIKSTIPVCAKNGHGFENEKNINKDIDNLEINKEINKDIDIINDLEINIDDNNLVDLEINNNIDLDINREDEINNDLEINKDIDLDINKEDEINNIKINKPDMTLNEDQQRAFDQFILGKNLFITGSGGTGKSHIINQIRQYCVSHTINFGVTSSTGVSAVNIQGTTLHSFLRVGLAKKDHIELYNDLRSKSYNKFKIKELQLLEVLVLDEVSMISDILFDKLSEYLKLIRNNNKPFGGIQMVITGDFLQLPNIEGDYCFHSYTWKELELETILLKKQMRQINDSTFATILNDLRYGIVKKSAYDLLKTRIIDINTEYSDFDIQPTILYAKNVNVDAMNENKLQNLIDKGYKTQLYPLIYNKNISGIKNWIKNNYINEEPLKLVINAQIMITYNIDPLIGICNGTRGIIRDMSETIVTIELVNGSLYNIEYITRKDDLYEKNLLKVSYMPIKLASAITVNKAQGLTLDKAMIDLGTDIFAPGMAYVALSRCRDLESVHLIDLSIKSLKKVSEEALEFYKKIN